MSLSFDPARDTPEAMARYGRSFSRDADWAFVTTRSPEALAPIRPTTTSGCKAMKAREALVPPLAGLSHRRGARHAQHLQLSFLDPVLLGNDIATLGLYREQDVACALSGK